MRRKGTSWVPVGLLRHEPAIDQRVGGALAAHASGILAGGTHSLAITPQPGVVKVLERDLPDTYCTAKVASTGCLPSMTALGMPSDSFAPGYHLRVLDVINNQNGLIFYGFGAAAAPFLGGVLCVQPPLARTTIMNSGGTPLSSDCSGSFLFDIAAWIRAGNGPGQPGDTLFAQCWFRDPADVNNVGLSDGLSFAFCP